MSAQAFAEKLQVKSDKFTCLLDDGKHCAILSFEKRKYNQRSSNCTNAHHDEHSLQSDEDYHHHATHIYEFYHIEIPSEYRGKGIAMPFAKACFDYALEHQWKVKVTCTYLREKFLGLHSGHYKSILVE